MVECLSSNHPLLNRTLVKFFFILHSSRSAEKCRVAWWSVAPWPIHSRIWRCYPGSTERTERSGAGRPSWILASSVSRPFSIKPAGLATFHYDNKIYRIWGLGGRTSETEGRRGRGAHHDAQNATGSEDGWLILGITDIVGCVCMGREGANRGRRLAF